MSSNYIELNGKRYNALTGEMLAQPPAGGHKAAAQPAKSTTHSTASTARGHGLIDGFVGSGVKNHPALPTKAPSASHASATASTAVALSKPVSKPIMDIRRSPGNNTVHHQPEHSKTLMRTAVKKPMPTLKRTLKTHTRTDILATVPQHHLAPKPSIRTIDEKRLKHARQVAKSQLISRFGHVDFPARATPVSGVRTPAQTALAKAIQTTHQSRGADIKPVYASSAAVAQPSMDIFEQALARANGHKETYVKPKKQLKHAAKKRSFGRKLTTAGAAVLAVLLIGGFIAYQNTANIEMRIASTKAGMHAQLPGYKPAGFTASNFTYDTGAVAVNFHNNHDGRTYKVIQKLSNWDSNALASEYVASVAGTSYHTLQAGGRTIYAYGNNNATWVDSGVWYTITSDGALSTSQLLDLARSI